MTRHVVGVDPGQTGAIAVFDPDENRLLMWDMPTLKGQVDAHLLLDTLSGCRFDRVYLEQIGMRKGEGIRSTATAQRNGGILYGLFVGFQRPIVEVTPSVWVQALGLPRTPFDASAADRRAAKEARRLRAKQLWPAQADLFDRVKDHGRADAALIAYWGSQQ